jgi:glycosyltransferase involved in cell wall biosynthesis
MIPPDPHNTAALSPSYFEERHIRSVASQTREQLDQVLVIDDGSTDGTSAEAGAAGAEVIRHERNQGKGAAIKTGLRALLERSSVQWIIILDGDGQHLPAEIPRFLDAAREGSASLIVGNRMDDTRHMPLIRKLTNLTMSGLISAMIGQRVPDSQCGFRLFHRTLATAFLEAESSNFDFESEMLVLAARRGIKIAAAPVSTIYGEEVSKIHPVRDTIRFFKLLSRLRSEARKN